ncbi:hypothetical protein, partial [Slackia isoflavoniconvertens]|uniref:hypothetical protein n=1 Tax=Slackia isoflavoniconvertens TaxID=572010 RepID=UPI001C6A2AC1
ALRRRRSPPETLPLEGTYTDNLTDPLGTQAIGKPRFKTTVDMQHDAATARLARASSKSHGEVGPSFLTTLPYPNQSRPQKASF